ncbi:MAG: YD repeat-containing protein, partial [Marivirga sp.]
TNYEFNDDSAIASFNHKFGKVKLNRISNNQGVMPFSKNSHERLSSTSSDISRNYLVYDSSGFLTKRIFQNPYGVNTSNNNESYGFGYTYYENGRVSSKYKINSIGSIYHNSRSAVIEYVYDDKGVLEIERTIYPGITLSSTYISDNWGNRTDILHPAGEDIARTTMEIDIYGSIKKISTYNEDGILIGAKFGVAVVKKLYDDKGRLIVESYFGPNLKPILFNNTHAKAIVSLDERGNVLSTYFYGLNGQVVVDNTGCEKVLLVYDLSNNPVERGCYKLEGGHMIDHNGVSKYLGTYNDYGYYTGIKMYGLDGLPVNNTEGFSSVIFQYDENWNVINESYYDTSGLSTSMLEGGANNYYKYDSKGNLIEQTFKDKSGKNITIDGIHKYSLTYDKLGRKIEEAYLDSHDNLVMPAGMPFSKKLTVYAKGKGYIESENYYNDENKLIFPVSGYSDKPPVNLLNNEKSRNSYTLDITSNPSDALVFVDDIYVGNTPVLKDVLFGAHDIKVVKNGYIKNEISVNLNDVGNISENIVLLKEPKLDFKDILIKAKAGESESQKIVGNHYLDGDIVEKDESKALDWYKKSALQSNPKAIYNIGYLYSSGRGVEEDQKVALLWFKKSANLGFSLAQNMVGRYFLNGWAGEKNIGLSFQSFLKAANQGEPNSAIEIAFMHHSGQGREKNFSESAYWFHLASQLGNEEAYQYIGGAYLYGQGVNQDAKKAKYWLEKACKSKSFSKMSCGQLGLMYDSAVGIANNYVKAIEYYEKAMLAGGDSNAFPLGYLILQGKGTSVDLNRAVKLFKVAEKNGDVRAKEWLVRLGYY